MSDRLTDTNQFVRFQGTLNEGTINTSQAFAPTGLTGATSASRYVGATASSSPASGTFAVGDFVIAQTGAIFVCTVAGSPGTWVDAATVGPSVSSVFTRTGSVVAVSGDYFGVVAAALTGATGQATRYVGGNASGAPGSGTFLTGDFVVNLDASVFICTVAGSPGTWVQVVAGSVAAGAITNAMVNSSAAIAYSKLTLTGSVVNADIAAAAAIAVSKIAPGLAGQVLQGVTPSYAYPPGFEIAYDQITSGVNVASTTEGTPTAIITGTSHTYENVPYSFEFYSPQVTDSSAATGTVTLLLIQDGSSIGRIAVQDSVSVTTQMIQALTGRYRFTPSAGAHTYGISAFASSTTGTPAVGAGAAGSGVLVPAYLRITKC